MEEWQKMVPPAVRGTGILLKGPSELNRFYRPKNELNQTGLGFELGPD